MGVSVMATVGARAKVSVSESGYAPGAVLLTFDLLSASPIHLILEDGAYDALVNALAAHTFSQAATAAEQLANPRIPA